MGFKLMLEFSGVCMFAPEAGERQRMHVFLPKQGHAHGSDRHVAVLAFDSAHLQRDSEEGHDTDVLVSFAGFGLEIGGAGANVDLHLCPEIVNVRETTRKAVDQTLFADGSHPRLLSRVVLRAGNMSAVEPGACWEWGGRYRPMAHRAQWQIDYPEAAAVELNLVSWGEHPHRTLTLYPIKSRLGVPEVHLQVLHLPTGDLPPLPEEHPTPPVGTQAEHFRSFYTLFDAPVPVVLPRFRAEDCDAPTSCPRIVRRGGSPFNCMVAGDY